MGKEKDECIYPGCQKIGECRQGDLDHGHYPAYCQIVCDDHQALWEFIKMAIS